MTEKTNEVMFQNDMIRQLIANGWLLGKPEDYNRELALYPEDLLGFSEAVQQGLVKNDPSAPDSRKYARYIPSWA